MERRALEKEMSRVEKWLVMVRDSAKWFPPGARNHAKMAERVWKVCQVYLFILKE